MSQRGQRSLTLLAVALASLSGIAALAASGTAPETPPDEAARLMAPIHAVLTHPGCLNCHTMTDYPTQGLDRHRHRLGVVRGKDGHGAPGMTCNTCHQSRNQAASGVPGAKGWHLAPLSMAWEKEPGVAMSPAELCRSLLDRKKNGALSLEELENHLATENLVLWTFEPGNDARNQPRPVPPLTHQELLQSVRAWIEAGTPCPP